MVTSLVRAAGVWLLLMGAEVAHGIARTLWLAPVVGDFHARQIAVFTGSLLILLIVGGTIRWMQAPTARRLLLSDYNLRQGGLLPIGLAVMALSPWLATRIRGRTSGTQG
jgi:hypothetical protein